jgi:hypothetical protein
VSLGVNPPFSQAGIVTLAGSIVSTAAGIPLGGDTLVVTNPNTGLAWIAVGVGSVTAAPGAGYPVLPGQRRVIGLGPLCNAVAVLLASGSGPIYVETGMGSAT